MADRVYTVASIMEQPFLFTFRFTCADIPTPCAT